VKGLPQGSVLSPLLYNIGGTEIDSRLTRGVLILQYADDIVIYASGNIFQRILKLLQGSLNSVDVFFVQFGPVHKREKV
jgi:retron-type reverse transcriptase